jgi:glucose/mannose-6-phosphate isomerase
MELNKDVLDTVNFLPDQLWEAWEESRKVALPESYRNFKRVLVCGMGGSALGGRVVRAYAADRAGASIDVSTEYNLPVYVDGETLIIASSYSGNTEETVSALNQAIEKKVPIFVISSGGKLAESAKEHSLPIYTIDPQFNPSGQPRLAVGYSIGAIFGALANTGVLPVTDEEIKKVVSWLKENQPLLQKKGEELAKEIQGKMPILVSSEHLLGASHVLKNQLNESAKSFSALFDIPELNHHLMEGLKNPAEATKNLFFIFFASNLYHGRVQKRYSLTEEVVGKNNIKTYQVVMGGSNKLEQVLELIQLGSYVQAYLGAIYGEDPLAIPWVDYFKDKLSQ